MEQEESGKKQRTVKNETSTVLTGLEGNSLYLITVKGFNSIGQGPASAAVTAKTRKARECSADTNYITLYMEQRLPVKFALNPLVKSGVIDLVGRNSVRSLFEFAPAVLFSLLSSRSTSSQPHVDSRGQQRVFKLGPSKGKRQ